jgi:hypothetical protein
MIRRDGAGTIPFNLLREAWNEYVFSDNVIVRIRLILTAVIEENRFGPLSFHNEKVTTVLAPEDLKGTPGEFVQGSYQGVPRWECPILLRYEKWNEYSLDGGACFAKIIFVANRAFRLMNAFDKFGEPVYCVEGKPLIRVFEKTENEEESIKELYSGS